MAADPTDAALIPLDRSGGGMRVDVVFPVMHGTYGGRRHDSGLLDLAGLPFVGAGVLGSAIGMDKDVSKRLLQAAKIPVVALDYRVPLRLGARPEIHSDGNREEI